MKHITKKRAVALMIFLLLGVYLIWENCTVGVTRYTIREGIRDDICIAHVSDVHNSSLWKQTIDLLTEARPDAICITGDLVDSRLTNVEKALAFAAEAVKIAPCYYVTGNHELRLPATHYEQLILGLQALGVHVLQNETVDLLIGQTRIALTGASWGSSLYLGQRDESEDLTLLLAHAPEEIESYAAAGFDLVLSGHAHGGQFRIPLVGGLYSPGEGFFPEYDNGLYTSGNTKMIVSRGIGNSVIPVRILNRPELVIITLKSA